MCGVELEWMAQFQALHGEKTMETTTAAEVLRQEKNNKNISLSK